MLASVWISAWNEAVACGVLDGVGQSLFISDAAASCISVLVTGA